jgi:hypothetical protein
MNVEPTNVDSAAAKPKSEASECPPKVGRDGRGRAGLESVRIVRVQRMYFDPPDLDGRMPRVSKWGR